MHHAGLITENIALSEENERMTVAYKLILEDRKEARRAQILMHQMYRENPNLMDMLRPYADQFSERSLWLIL